MLNSTSITVQANSSSMWAMNLSSWEVATYCMDEYDFSLSIGSGWLYSSALWKEVTFINKAHISQILKKKFMKIVNNRLSN